MVGDQLVWQGNPSWKGMTLWYLRYFFVAVVVDLVAFGLFKLGLFSAFFFVLVILIGLAIILAIGHLIRKTTVYTITKQRVAKKSGVFNQRKEQAHIEKISNITVDRSLSERLLGIGRINVDTAADVLGDDILQFWGVQDPYNVESMIDGLRLDPQAGSNEEVASDETPWDHPPTSPPTSPPTFN